MVKLYVLKNNTKSLDLGLFWDVDKNDIDYDKHGKFVVKRVLAFGSKSDFDWVKTRYGLSFIKDVVENTEFFSKKTQNFWRTIFNLDK